MTSLPLRARVAQAARPCPEHVAGRARPVGSSTISMSGSPIRARASMARASSPPGQCGRGLVALVRAGRSRSSASVDARARSSRGRPPNAGSMRRQPERHQPLDRDRPLAARVLRQIGAPPRQLARGRSGEAARPALTVAALGREQARPAPTARSICPRRWRRSPPRTRRPQRRRRHRRGWRGRRVATVKSDARELASWRQSSAGAPPARRRTACRAGW